MIDSLEPEFPRFVAWWDRQHVGVRLVLAPFVMMIMTVAMVLIFASALTWLPLVSGICELIGSTRGAMRGFCFLAARN